MFAHLFLRYLHFKFAVIAIIPKGQKVCCDTNTVIKKTRMDVRDDTKVYKDRTSDINYQTFSAEVN